MSFAYRGTTKPTRRRFVPAPVFDENALLQFAAALSPLKTLRHFCEDEQLEEARDVPTMTTLFRWEYSRVGAVCVAWKKTPMWQSLASEFVSLRELPDSPLAMMPMCAAFHTVTPSTAIQRDAVPRGKMK